MTISALKYYFIPSVICRFMYTTIHSYGNCDTTMLVHLGQIIINNVNFEKDAMKSGYYLKIWVLIVITRNLIIRMDSTNLMGFKFFRPF